MFNLCLPFSGALFHDWNKWSAIKRGENVVVYNASFPSLRTEERGPWAYQERTCRVCGAVQVRTVSG